MADEIIVIEIQDKIPQLIVDKLKAIAIYSNYAAGAIDKLDAASLKAALGNERLAQAQAKSAIAAERLFAAEARSSTELEKLTAASITAGIAQERLSQAKIKTATANETLALAQNRALISAEQLKQAEIKTKIAVESLTIAQVKLTNEQTKGSISNQKLKTEVIKTAISSQNLSTAIDKTSLAHLKLTQAQAKVIANNNKVQSSNSSLKSSFTTMGQKLLGIAATYITAREVIDLSNAYVGLENKLRVVTTSESQLSEVSARLFEIANKTRGPIEETASAFSRFDLALKPLGKSQEEVLRMTETINKAMVVAGATAGEQAAGLLQLSQAFNKGKLDGDEFRSVMELMPSVADAIAKKLGVARGELLLLAPQGKITAKVLSEALSEAADIIDAKFAKTVPTISQSMTVFRNSLISTMGEVEKGTGVFSKFALSLIDVSNYMQDNNLKIMSIVSAYSNVYIGITEVASILAKFVTGVDSSSSALDYMKWYLDKTALSIAFMADNLKRATSIMMFGANIAKGMSFDKAFIELKDSITATNGALDKLSASQAEFDKKLKTETAKKELTADINKLAIEYTNLNDIIEKSKRDKTPIFKSDLIALKDMEDKLKNLVDKKTRLYGEGLRGATQVTPKAVVDTKAVKNELTRAQTLAKINAELDKESGTLQRLSPDREIYNRMTEIQIQLANKKLAGGKIGITADAQELAGIEAKIIAIETEKKVSEERNRIYNESVAPANTYANTLKAATQLLAQGSINQQEYNKRVLLSKDAYASASNSLHNYNVQIALEQDLLKYVGTEQQVQTRLQQFIIEQRRQGIALGIDQIEFEKKNIEILIRKSQLQSELNNIHSSNIGVIEALGTRVNALNISYQNGTIGLNQYSLEINKAKLAMAELKLQSDSITFSDVALSSLGSLVENYKGAASELSIVYGDFFKTLEDGFANSIGKAIVQGDSLKTMLTSVAEESLTAMVSGLVKVGVQYLINAALGTAAQTSALTAATAASVAAATATAAAWAPAAAEVSLATMGTNSIPASAALIETQMLSKTLSMMALAGFESGGFTGMGATSQVAGVVHGQEYVVNAPATARNRPILEAMNRGASVGTGSQLSVLIQNYGTSKEFEIQKTNENEIRIIARDEAKRVVQSDTPKLMASEIANPNSSTSKSLSQNTQTMRRR